MTDKKKSRSLFGIVFVLFAKSAKLLKLFKVVKLMKFTKVFVTLISMALSVVVYSFRYGIWFAIGLVVILFIHEMGHVWAMVRKGYKASAPIFIPMLGAAIFAPPFKNAEEEAYIGYGGPLIGAFSSLAAFGLWFLDGQRHELLLMFGYLAAFINVFNLLPIRPLDGGRVTQIVGGWFKWVGLVGLLMLTWVVRDPSILLIWILVISDFDFKPTFEFGTGLTCLVGMSVLMLMGYGDQPWWLNWLDVLLGSMIVFRAFMMMRDESPDEKVSPIAPMRVRVKWFALYVSLLVALVGLMMVQAPYLQATLK